MQKWLRAAIPALLLHCSIGTVYCWSVLSESITASIGWDKAYIEWAFSFAIFFLGMSAAFLGNIVEKNIHLSSLIATICFALGMVGTGFFLWLGTKYNHNVGVLLGIYFSYGFLMGVGCGLGYLSPVKTLMLWFKDNKGLATGLAVAGFGAAKAIASPIMEAMLKIDATWTFKMFYVLGAAYFVMMFVGHLLLKKPDGWHEPAKGEAKPKIMDVIKSRGIINYVGIWLMFYLNITCGLALISQEKMIVKCIGLAGSIGVIAAVSAVFNAGGRLGFSAIGDKMKDRNTVYKIIFIMSILITALVVCTSGITKSYVGGDKNVFLIILVLALIFLVNAGYGGGFSNLPTLLSDHYGMSNISAIHGISLSAWAFAGLTGNQMATLIVSNVGEKITIEGNYVVNPQGYQTVLYVTLALYAVSLLICFLMVKSAKKIQKQYGVSENAQLKENTEENVAQEAPSQAEAPAAIQAE